MAFVANAKAIEQAHELASKLTIRLNGALAVTETVDADGCPVVSVGPGTAGAKNVVFKLRNIDWSLAKDSLGLSAGAYGPNVVMLATEADNAAGAGADAIDPATLLLAIGLATQVGSLVEWYQSAAGAAPTVSTFNTASNLKASFWPHAKWTITAGQ